MGEGGEVGVGCALYGFWCEIVVAIHENGAYFVGGIQRPLAML